MAFVDLLINIGTVRRWTVDPLDPIDAYGNPKMIWADHLTNQLCRISYPKGRQVQRDTEVVPVDAVLFTQNIDVLEKDRVSVDGIQFEILFVATLQNGGNEHHKELSLARVIP